MSGLSSLKYLRLFRNMRLQFGWTQLVDDMIGGFYWGCWWEDVVP